MLRAWITEAARGALIEAAGQSAPYETGGILIGVLREGDAWIVMAVEVEDPSRGRSRFVIPEGVTPAVVEIARQMDSRLGYIGDWHTHPADLPASPTDKGTLAKSARRRRTDIQPLVLIVVRATPSGWSVEALCDAGAGPEAIELRLTGALPAAEPGAAAELPEESPKAAGESAAVP